MSGSLPPRAGWGTATPDRKNSFEQSDRARNSSSLDLSHFKAGSLRLCSASLFVRSFKCHAKAQRRVKEEDMFRCVCGKTLPEVCRMKGEIWEILLR